MPGSRNIVNSGDAIFDETFHSAIATTWQQHKDSLALQPLSSFIPDATTTLEHTGTLIDNNVDIEEGEKNAADDYPNTSERLDNPSIKKKRPKAIMSSLILLKVIVI